MELAGKLVAIIDDDPRLRTTLERLLEVFEYRTESFGCARAFLNALTGCKADCVVIDINLGPISGLELASNPALAERKLPVIFMTGCAEEAVRARAMALGCVAFLRKPFKAAELLDAIAKAIRSTGAPMLQSRLHTDNSLSD